MARHVFSEVENIGGGKIYTTRKVGDSSTLEVPRSLGYPSDAKTTDALTCCELQVGGASLPQALPSLTYTGEAFNIFEDTPYQHKNDTANSTKADDLVLPGLHTPEKVPVLTSPTAVRQSHSTLLPRFGKEGGSKVPELVALCAGDLRDLWESSVRNGGRRVLFLWQKFGSMGPPPLRDVLFRPPPSKPPAPFADSWPWAQLKGTSHPADIPQGALPTIARRLCKRLHDDIESRADGASWDLVSNILRSCHVQSERRLPSAEAILKSYSTQEREGAVLWLIQICATANFQDSVLYKAVLLLDRYCAAVIEPMSECRLQLVAVAILGISSKMNENSEPLKLRCVLVQLAHNRFTSPEIHAAEQEVLHRLGFAIATPTAVEFLDTLLLPHGFLDPECPGVAASPVHVLGQFLLQLSLLDAPLHYRYPHAVLAAGSVYVALWCTQQGPECMLALLEDVAACFEDGCQAP